MITLHSEDDANRTVVQNLGHAIVKKTAVKISGNEVLSMEDSNVYHCYKDLWKMASERKNDHYQGIDTSANGNATRIRFNAGDKDASVAVDKAIAVAFGNHFCIPLDFELLESHMPFYQSALGDRLEYELTFKDYSNVVRAMGDKDTSYSNENISLEYDMVTLPELACMISSQYKGRLAILYDRVLWHLKISKDKSYTLWNINLNVLPRSMEGILMLFEDARQPFTRNNEAFSNPKITKVEVTLEGSPTSSSVRECMPTRCGTRQKLFSSGNKRHPDMTVVAKDLGLADVSIGEFLTSKYSLWLYLRTTDDDRLHGSGRPIENARRENPDHKNSRGARCIEYLSLLRHGCAA